MARSSTVHSPRPALLPAQLGAALRRRLIETGGVALIGVAMALFLALISHNPADPSPNVATSGQVRNMLGVPGAWAADVLLRALGLGALAIPGLIGTWGWRVAAHRGVTNVAIRIATLPIACLLLAVALADLPTPSLWPLREGLGGVLGLLVLGRFEALADLFHLGIAASGVALICAWLGAGTFAYCLGFAVGEWRLFGKALVRLGAFAGRGLLALARKIGGMRMPARSAFAPLRGGREAVAAEDAPLQPRSRPATSQAAAAPRAARTVGARVEPTLKNALRRLDPRKEAAAPVVEAEDEDEPAPVARTAAPADLVEPATPKPRTMARGRDAQPDLPLDDTYRLPALELLQMPRDSGPAEVDEEALAANAKLLESVLDDFGVKGQIVKVRPGPVVTLYELEPAPGIKASRIIGLADDIARYMSAVSVRVAVVPGRTVIGIELPNKRRETVYMRELLASNAYNDAGGDLPLVLGKDIGGGPVIVSLERMPHLLIAGTTGSGKSVAVNTMILSLLYRLPPDRCRFIMIDPKQLELSAYKDIPHLLAEVVTDPRKAVVALKWTVREMENRYRAMSTLGVRNIAGYNARLAEARDRGEILTRRVQTGFDPDSGKPVFEEQPLDMTPLTYIVVVVDELADLMLVAGKEIEAAIQRLAQMARAAGIHLIMATQRPSVDVITGTIKANFPTRISFQVTSKIDSRTILNEGGAEQLLGQGDMLYMAGGGRITRVHGPFVSDAEVEQVVSHLRKQGEPAYLDAVTEEADEFTPPEESDSPDPSGDDLYDKAIAVVMRERKASTSLIQRHLRIGYNRAATLIDRMESEGVISAPNHAGKREVLVGADA